VPGIAEDVLAAAQIALQTHDFRLVLLSLLGRDLKSAIELRHLDLFLGDDVHRVADLRFQVAHHVAGAVDLERHGDALLDRVRNLAKPGGEIAAEIRDAEDSPQHADAQRRDDQLLDHGKWPPKMARFVARADVSGSLSAATRLGGPNSCYLGFRSAPSDLGGSGQ